MRRSGFNLHGLPHLCSIRWITRVPSSRCPCWGWGRARSRAPPRCASWSPISSPSPASGAARYGARALRTEADWLAPSPAFLEQKGGHASLMKLTRTGQHESEVWQAPHTRGQVMRTLERARRLPQVASLSSSLYLPHLAGRGDADDGIFVRAAGGPAQLAGGRAAAHGVSSGPHAADAVRLLAPGGVMHAYTLSPFPATVLATRCW